MNKTIAIVAAVVAAALIWKSRNPEEEPEPVHPAEGGAGQGGGGHDMGTLELLPNGSGSRASGSRRAASPAAAQFDKKLSVPKKGMSTKVGAKPGREPVFEPLPDVVGPALTTHKDPLQELLR